MRDRRFLMNVQLKKLRNFCSLFAPSNALLSFGKAEESMSKIKIPLLNPE